MPIYQVQSTKSYVFTLTQNTEPIGSLIYQSWFSFKAKINLTGKDSFDVKPKGIWGTTIEVKQQESLQLNLKMNWKGEIIVDQKVSDLERHFVFKQRSLLQNTFVLLDRENQELVIVEPNFDWTHWRLEYQLTTSERFEELTQKELLLLTIVHCANYYLTLMTTMAAV